MACCGEPLLCCGDNREGYKPKDGFYCGCGCLNGITQITVSLILVFAGFWFSVAAAGDCKFAIIDDGFIPPMRFSEDFNVGSRRGVGFLTFEKPDGGCYYYNEANLDQEEVVRSYVDYLGSDWNLGRVVAVMTPVIALFTWLYMWSFVCTAQVLACRYTIGTILGVILAVLQGLTFTVLTSSWCDENGCELSRSSGLSIGALLCFFIAGVCFFLSFSYPGEEDLPVFMATKDEFHDEPLDEEDLEQALTAEGEEEPIADEEEADKDEEVSEEKASEEQAPEEQAPEEQALEEEAPEEQTSEEQIPKEITPRETVLDEASEGKVDVFEDVCEDNTEIEA